MKKSPTVHPNSFAGKLRKARIKAGLTQSELSKHCNTQPAYICALEYGLKPANSTVVLEAKMWLQDFNKQYNV